MSVILPDNWNLRIHGGTDKTGALVFADLRQPRFELRWQTPRAFPRKTTLTLLQKKLAALHKTIPARAVKLLDADSARITQPDRATVLLAANNRLYELHWPTAPQSVNEITDDFRRTVPLLEGKPDHFWSLYGAQGWLPANARLKKTSILPGATTLTFRDNPSQFTLGSVSLADRLLKIHSLRDWAAAAIPLIARHPTGTWEEAPDRATFTANTRRHLRRFTHRLTLQHDLPNNRICWQHHFTPQPVKMSSHY
jgi:hypothetical protein